MHSPAFRIHSPSEEAPTTGRLPGSDCLGCRLTGFVTLTGLGAYSLVEAHRMGAFRRGPLPSGAKGRPVWAASLVVFGLSCARSPNRGRYIRTTLLGRTASSGPTIVALPPAGTLNDSNSARQVTLRAHVLRQDMSSPVTSHLGHVVRALLLLLLVCAALPMTPFGRGIPASFGNTVMAASVSSRGGAMGGTRVRFARGISGYADLDKRGPWIEKHAWKVAEADNRGGGTKVAKKVDYLGGRSLKE
ncbi:Mitochondrial inner membrane organizing system component [Thecaphora frezii]